MELTPPDSVQIPYDSGQWVHLTCIYDNAGCLESCDSSHITCVDGTTQTSSQTWQANFDTDGFSIVVYYHCYVTMLHYKQDFVVPL